MEVDDEALMRRFQGGDSEAYEILVSRHLTFVVRHARRYIRDLAGAEDVAQLVFLRVWKSKDQFREAISFRGWLARITGRIALNEIRTRKRKRWTPRSSLSREDGVETGQEWVGGSERSSDPAQDLLKEERIDAVRMAIDKLEEPARQAIYLQNFENWSVARIAETLGLTIPATKSVLFRARKKLQQDLSSFMQSTNYPDRANDQT